MKQLMILRHAEPTGWQSAADDFSRPLCEAGTAHAQLIAAYISDHRLLPDDILCSPAQRTFETLQPLLALNPKIEPAVRYIPQLYNARTETIISLLDFSFAEKDRVLIVGHNPGLSELASKVTSNPEGSYYFGLTTGTLVVVDFDAGWSIGSGPGRLNQRVTWSDLSVD